MPCSMSQELRKLKKLRPDRKCCNAPLGKETKALLEHMDRCSLIKQSPMIPPCRILMRLYRACLQNILLVENNFVCVNENGK